MRTPITSLLMVVLVLACSKAAPEGLGASHAVPGAKGDGEHPPAEPVVRDDSTQLLFSFVDAQGRVQAVPKTSDVPDAVKARVLVVDLERSPEERQAHRYAFFTDLTTQRPDGSYAVTIVSRYDGARGQAAAAALPPPDGSILVYSATWCGFCKKAKAWLTEQHVPYIERDVEKTPGAQAELTQKLKAANVAGGGIPVIDWNGSLVMGFDRPALQKLLRDRPPALTAPDAGPGSTTP